MIMLQQIIFLLELFLSLVTNTIVFTKLLDGKTTFLRLVIFLFSIFLPFYVFFVKLNQYLITSIIITYLYSIISIKNIKNSIKIYVTLLNQSISVALTTSIILIIHLFNSNESINYYIDLLSNFILLFLILSLPKERIKIKFTNFLQFTSKIFKFYIIVLLYVFSFLSMLITYIPSFTSYNRWYKILVLLFILTCIVTIIVCPIFISNHISKNYYKKSVDIATQQIETQTHYYKKLSKNTEDLREFRHDYQNHLLVLQSYLDNNKIDEAKLYLNNSSKIFEQNISFKTGNYILDALLYNKSIKASEYNIEILFNGSFINFEIDPTDLCVIFGNALDNAIEACQKIDLSTKKEINLQVKHFNHLISFTISNPVLTPPEINNNFITTTKSDHINHGMGLYSIKKSVEKYNGCLLIECTDNIFILTITFST